MGMQGDFYQLLKEQGYTLGSSSQVGSGHALTNATTIWPSSIAMVCWWREIVARPLGI
jgi:hypothetical protein